MTPFDEYERYDGLGLAGLVKRGEVTAVELLEAAVDRVEARNSTINAVVMKLYDGARGAVAAGLPDGPFTGVPFLIKDIGSAIAGTPTTRGSRFFADAVVTEDSEHVKRLKRAGLVIFGKTNTCELGLSLTCEPQFYGPTRNPWDRTRISGGSSGGAAASVAARMLPMAHGGDGFGSIRAPAACCGLVGLKPSRGRNTMAPFVGEGLAGIATEHALTLTVRDSAALLDVTAGAGSGDPYVAPAPNGSFLDAIAARPDALRIAMTSKTPNGVTVDSDALRVLEQTARLCTDLGHQVEEADPPIDHAAVVPTFLTLMSVNTVVNLSKHPVSGRAARPEDVEKITWACVEMGRRVDSADYVRATQTAHRLGRQMAAFHADYDVLLTPGLATAPVELGWLDMMMDDVDEYWHRVFAFSPFTVWFNLTGQPAMMLPAGHCEHGLPRAVQIVGRYGDETTLFQLAGQLEAAAPWFDRLPDIVSRG